MAILRITRPPITAEMYDATQAKIGVDENPPDGLLMHSAGVADGVWQIIDVWESEEHAKRFDDERLGPAIREMTGDVTPRAPVETTVYELHNLLLP